MHKPDFLNRLIQNVKCKRTHCVMSGIHGKDLGRHLALVETERANRIATVGLPFQQKTLVFLCVNF